MNTCKTCKHFEPGDFEIPIKYGEVIGDQLTGGICKSKNVYGDDYTIGTQPKYARNQLVMAASEWGEIWVGPDFGCIHHAEPEVTDRTASNNEHDCQGLSRWFAALA